MQTFLPYPDVEASLKALDSRRLGKQRLEARTILDILLGRKDRQGWRRHPAVLMWAGCEEALKVYYNACLAEWSRRGHRNRLLQPEPVEASKAVFPWWFGRAEFHAAHRANLLRKDPEFYGRQGWSEDPGLPYWWPTQHQEQG